MASCQNVPYVFFHRTQSLLPDNFADTLRQGTCSEHRQQALIIPQGLLSVLA
jgi:hypothetical protein